MQWDLRTRQLLNTSSLLISSTFSLHSSVCGLVEIKISCGSPFESGRRIQVPAHIAFTLNWRYLKLCYWTRSSLKIIVHSLPSEGALCSFVLILLCFEYMYFIDALPNHHFAHFVITTMLQYSILCILYLKNDCPNSVYFSVYFIWFWKRFVSLDEYKERLKLVISDCSFIGHPCLFESCIWHGLEKGPYG